MHRPPVEDLDVEHIGTLPQHVLVAEAAQASKSVIDKDDSGVVGDDDGVIGEVDSLEKGVAHLLGPDLARGIPLQPDEVLRMAMLVMNGGHRPVDRVEGAIWPHLHRSGLVHAALRERVAHLGKAHGIGIRPRKHEWRPALHLLKRVAGEPHDRVVGEEDARLAGLLAGVGHKGRGGDVPYGLADDGKASLGREDPRFVHHAADGTTAGRRENPRPRGLLRALGAAKHARHDGPSRDER